MAEEILSKALENKSPSGESVDVIKLASALGVDVYLISEHDEFNAQLKKNVETGNYCIEVNEKHPVNRQRFSIAHELAHFFLHPDLVDERGSIDRSQIFDNKDRKVEFEANKLAGEILMPKEMVSSAMHRMGVTKDSLLETDEIQKIAEKFRVSFSVALLRLKELGYKLEYASLS